MRAILLSLLLSATVFAQGPTPAAKPPLTDAQLLKAAKHRIAVLEFQQAVPQRAKQLADEEAAISKELCGDQVFDYQAMACATKHPER